MLIVVLPMLAGAEVPGAVAAHSVPSGARGADRMDELPPPGFLRNVLEGRVVEVRYRDLEQELAC